MNKIGLHMGYWWGTDIKDLVSMLDLTHRAKLDIIEINPAWMVRMTDSECRDFLCRAKDYGMEITLNGGLDQTNDIASDSEPIRKAGVAYCTEVLKKMPALEIGIWSGVNYSAWLRVPGPDTNILEEKAKARELSIDSLKQIMRVAEDVGVDYCFEIVN